ncbi:uncharacterized protein ACBR49_016841 [Aulostomus maculatus]
MMGGCRRTLLLLLLTVAVALTRNYSHAEAVEENVLVKNLTDSLLKAIPPGSNQSSVTALILERNQITLDEQDRQSLVTYPRLEELHLDSNLVTHIPAKYFSVVPGLRVLSLSRNHISSLDGDSFSGLDELTVMSLSHNQLTSLPAQLIQGLRNLQELNLEENLWNCSCPLLGSFEEIKAAGVIIDQPPVPGNTWKFTVCVAAVALCTCTLIVCAIKGPSWYRLFHNYRHQRLYQDEHAEEDAVSTVFSDTGGYMSHQTFNFEEEGQIEEEDDYFEDPYIKREECHAGEGTTT